MNQTKIFLLILYKNIDQTKTMKRRDYSIISMPWSQKLPKMICKQKFKILRTRYLFKDMKTELKNSNNTLYILLKVYTFKYFINIDSNVSFDLIIEIVHASQLFLRFCLQCTLSIVTTTELSKDQRNGRSCTFYIF